MASNPLGIIQNFPLKDKAFSCQPLPIRTFKNAIPSAENEEYCHNHML
jgi:hypothetical protein